MTALSPTQQTRMPDAESEILLAVGELSDGRVTRAGKTVAVKGSAWLDHEWSSTVLDPDAAGWEWVGINLDDGGALMAFQIRSRSGAKLWAHAALRDIDALLDEYLPRDAVLDMSGLTFMDSAGIALLLKTARRVRTGRVG